MADLPHDRNHSIDVAPLMMRVHDEAKAALTYRDRGERDRVHVQPLIQKSRGYPQARLFVSNMKGQDRSHR